MIVQVVEALATGVDVRLDHVVSNIDYRDVNRVVVSTNHGDFTAPRVIVTLPHGVLRAGCVTFTPELPAWKRDAIHRIHTGISDKFYLRFASPFWDRIQMAIGSRSRTVWIAWAAKETAAGAHG